MSRANRSADAGVASSQELLRAALDRSARRNARVAGWRVTLRWIVWGIGKLLRYLAVASALVLPIALAWHYWPDRSSRQPPQEVASTPTRTPDQPATRAPAPASMADAVSTPASAVVEQAPTVADDAPAPALTLRLDESFTIATPPGPAASQGAGAQSDATTSNEPRPRPE